jgi:hypothetical protein
MEIESLAAALEREHHEIDDGLAFLGSAELPEGWVCAQARPVTRNAGR